MGLLQPYKTFPLLWSRSNDEQKRWKYDHDLRFMRRIASTRPPLKIGGTMMSRR